MDEPKKETMDSADEIAFEDQFDYSFSVNVTYIHTMEDLHKQLIVPLEAGHRMFYRGERVDSRFLLDDYGSNGQYLELFNRVFGKADQYHLYDT